MTQTRTSLFQDSVKIDGNDKNVKSGSLANEFEIRNPNKTKAYYGPVAGFMSFRDNFAKGAVFGIFHEKILPSSNERFIFYSELSYYFFKYDFKEERYIDENDFEITNGEVKSGYLRLGPNIRFVMIKGGKLEPYIGVGASVDLNTSYRKSSETNYRYFSVQRTTNMLETETKSFSIRSNAEIGLLFKSVILNLRYDIPEESTYITLGYRLIKK